LQLTRHKFVAESVKLVPIGDLHIGSDKAMMVELREYMCSLSDNSYIILMGDILENALRNSLGDVYTQKLSPEDAIDAAIKFFGPFKDKILGAVSGNHERRSRKQVGLNPMKIVAGALDIPYDESILVLDITVKQHEHAKGANYAVAVTHGISAARTIGAKLNANSKFLDYIEDIDVYITGHVHQPAYTKFAKYVIDRYNKKCSKRYGYLVLIPAWVDDDEYVETHLYSPTVHGFLEIELFSKKRIRIVGE